MQVDQIPSGYKLTDVGIIPSDWDVVKLGEKFNVIAGIGFNKSEYVEHGVKLLRIDNVSHGKISWDSNAFLPLSYIDTFQNFVIYENDILLALNRPITQGELKIALIKKEDTPCVLYQRVGKIVFLDQNVNRIYAYYLLTKYVKQFVLENSVGSDQPFISTVQLKNNLKIPLPPIEEQKRIAQVLSDIDELIRSLDELIIKKRNIKQGTMQLLLTGKQRLPGYSGEWEVKTFDDCFKFLTTGSNARSDLSESGEVKYIHYGDIHAKKLPILDCAKDFIPGIARNKVKNLPLLEDGDLIIADASEDYQGLGKSIEIKNVNNCEIVAGLHTLLLRADKLVLADGFKAYITSIESVKNALIKIATGISVFGISKKAIKSIQLFLPPLEEQKAIARILSDMDEEIEVLEQKRNKYQDIKKGMMQELLTGKTRLV